MAAAAGLLQVASAGCAAPPPPAIALAAPALEEEARAFMARYAEALRSRDREAIASLYHPDGTWMIVNGKRWFDTHAAMREAYRTQWQAPDSFAWKDLSFDVAGPDSVMVIGGFDWGSGGKTLSYAYSALLKRVGNEWRIRVEHETTAPAN